MTNTIKNTVTYSGADITVIAYKNSGNAQSPASKFKMDTLERELKEEDKNIAEYQREIKVNKKKQLAAEESLLINEARKSRAVLEDTIFYTAQDFKAEGKLQNEKRDDALVDADMARESLLGAEDRREEIQKEIAELSAAPFFILGSMHTLSYSSFREKFAVRSLGRVQAKGYTRGPRTVAGTMVFSVFQEHELMKLTETGEETQGSSHPKAVMLDQLAPFNVMLLFANEYGAYSSLHLFDIELEAEGQEMSIDQIRTHNTMNFYAKEMIPMTSLGNAFSSYDEMISNSIKYFDGESGSVKSKKRSFKELIDGKLDNPFSEKEDTVQSMLTASRGLF